MRRKLDSSLDVWIRSSHRKPLVLFGARGVGKTALLESLANRAHRDIVRIDFAENPQASMVFQHASDPLQITRSLEALASRRIDPSRTLLFLDEIQLCDEALMSLRRFKADVPELPVAAAGSSLGIHLARGAHSALPTDHVNTETVRPLDFEEFCWALGEERAYEVAAECAASMQPCPIHQKMMSLYREYLLVGGMPQVVARYCENRRVDDARQAQDSIRLLYVASMSQDSEGVDPAKIAATWRSLPSQLAKSTGSTKFMWKYIARGAKSERYADALDWLQQAGLVNLCTQVSGAGNPAHLPVHVESGLGAFENPSSFKAYVADTGLLARAYGATLSDFLECDLMEPGAGSGAGSAGAGSAGAGSAGAHPASSYGAGACLAGDHSASARSAGVHSIAAHPADVHPAGDRLVDVYLANDPLVGVYPMGVYPMGAGSVDAGSAFGLGVGLAGARPAGAHPAGVYPAGAHPVGAEREKTPEFPSRYRQPLFTMGLAENYVMQELVAAGARPHYWGMRSKHEAQFVLETEKGTVPIGVKPAGGRNRAVAIRDFAARYNSPYMLQVADHNIERHTRDGREIRRIPPYALAQVVA